MIRITFFLISSFILTNFLYSCGSCGSDPVATEDSAKLSGEIDADFLENNEITESVVESDDYDPYLDVEYLETIVNIDIPSDIAKITEYTSTSGIVLRSDIITRSDISDPLPEPLPYESLAMKVKAVDITGVTSVDYYKFAGDEPSPYKIIRAGKKFELNLKKGKKYILEYYLLTKKGDVKIKTHSFIKDGENYETFEVNGSLDLGKISFSDDGFIESENNPETLLSIASALDLLSCDSNLGLLLYMSFDTPLPNYGIKACQDDYIDEIIPLSDSTDFESYPGIVGNAIKIPQSKTESADSAVIDLESNLKNTSEFSFVGWIDDRSYLNSSCESSCLNEIMQWSNNANEDIIRIYTSGDMVDRIFLPEFIINNGVGELPAIFGAPQLTEFLDLGSFTFVATTFSISENDYSFVVYYNDEKVYIANDIGREATVVNELQISDNNIYLPVPSQNGSTPSDVIVDEFAFYNRVLSDDEILEIYNFGNTIRGQ